MESIILKTLLIILPEFISSRVGFQSETAARPVGGRAGRQSLAMMRPLPRALAGVGTVVVTQLGGRWRCKTLMCDLDVGLAT